jgi:hypothetical protein
MWLPRCPCVSVSPLPSTSECLNQSLRNWYAYRGNWVHLNGVLLKSLPSASVSVAVTLLSLLDNNVKTATKNCCWSCFPLGQCRAKGKWEIHSRTSCINLIFFNPLLFASCTDTFSKCCKIKREWRGVLSSTPPYRIGLRPRVSVGNKTY